MQKNGKIFKNEVTGPVSWKYGLKQDLLLVKHRTKSKNVDCLDQWIVSLNRFELDSLICVVMLEKTEVG